MTAKDGTPTPNNIIKLFQDLVNKTGLSEKYQKAWGTFQGITSAAWKLTDLIESDGAINLADDIQGSALWGLLIFVEENWKDLRSSDVSHTINTVLAWPAASRAQILECGRLARDWTQNGGTLDATVLSRLLHALPEAVECTIHTEEVERGGIKLVGPRVRHWWREPV